MGSHDCTASEQCNLKIIVFFVVIVDVVGIVDIMGINVFKEIYLWPFLEEIYLSQLLYISTFGLDNNFFLYLPTTQKAFSYITENDRLPFVSRLWLRLKKVWTTRCKTEKDTLKMQNSKGHIKNAKQWADMEI